MLRAGSTYKLVVGWSTATNEVIKVEEENLGPIEQIQAATAAWPAA